MVDLVGEVMGKEGYVHVVDLGGEARGKEGYVNLPS